MREIISDTLSGCYDVTCAQNGKEAHKLVGSINFDLIITDLVMPEMNGIDLLMTVQKIRPDQKFIAISGGGGISGRFDYLPVAQLLGAYKILRKPFQVSELRNSVELLMNNEQ